jgi:hypothetical protein
MRANDWKSQIAAAESFQIQAKQQRDISRRKVADLESKIIEHVKTIRDSQTS